jgi:hypothetical protein
LALAEFLHFTPHDIAALSIDFRLAGRGAILPYCGKEWSKSTLKFPQVTAAVTAVTFMKLKRKSKQLRVQNEIRSDSPVTRRVH